MEGTNPAVAINDIDERDVRMQDRLSEMLTDKSQVAGTVLGNMAAFGSQFQKLHLLTNSTTQALVLKDFCFPFRVQIFVAFARLLLLEQHQYHQCHGAGCSARGQGPVVYSRNHHPRVKKPFCRQ